MFIVSTDELVRKLSAPQAVAAWPVRVNLILKTGRVVRNAMAYSPTRIDTTDLLQGDEVVDVVVDR
jgi:hypothetical protein